MCSFFISYTKFLKNVQVFFWVEKSSASILLIIFIVNKVKSITDFFILLINILI